MANIRDLKQEKVVKATRKWKNVSQVYEVIIRSFVPNKGSTVCLRQHNQN